jgi:hypothetical protein
MVCNTFLSLSSAHMSSLHNVRYMKVYFTLVYIGGLITKVTIITLVYPISLLTNYEHR